MHIDDLSKVLDVDRSWVEQHIGYGEGEASGEGGASGALDRAEVRRFFEDHGTTYHRRVISFINLRGGVGKTTGAVSLATRASQYGFTTCLLDLDSQGSATMSLNRVPEEDEPVFHDIWQRPEEMLMGSISRINDLLYILPSSLENGLLDASMASPMSQKKGVRDVAEELWKNGMDLIVVDAPPSLGAAVISSICASDEIVIPVAGDPFSLKGLQITLQEVEAICDTFGMAMPEIHILYTHYDRRVNMSRDTLDHLREKYPDRLVEPPIRTSTEFSKALAERRSVFGVRRNTHARKDYDKICRKLLGINRPDEDPKQGKS